MNQGEYGNSQSANEHLAEIEAEASTKRAEWQEAIEGPEAEMLPESSAGGSKDDAVEQGAAASTTTKKESKSKWHEKNKRHDERQIALLRQEYPEQTDQELRRMYRRKAALKTALNRYGANTDPKIALKMYARDTTLASARKKYGDQFKDLSDQEIITKYERERKKTPRLELKELRLAALEQRKERTLKEFPDMGDNEMALLEHPKRLSLYKTARRALGDDFKEGMSVTEVIRLYQINRRESFSQKKYNDDSLTAEQSRLRYVRELTTVYRQKAIEAYPGVGLKAAVQYRRIAKHMMREDRTLTDWPSPETVHVYSIMRDYDPIPPMPESLVEKPDKVNRRSNKSKPISETPSDLAADEQSRKHCLEVLESYYHALGNEDAALAIAAELAEPQEIVEQQASAIQEDIVVQERQSFESEQRQNVEAQVHVAQERQSSESEPQEIVEQQTSAIQADIVVQDSLTESYDVQQEEASIPVQSPQQCETLVSHAIAQPEPLIDDTYVQLVIDSYRLSHLETEAEDSTSRISPVPCCSSSLLREELPKETVKMHPKKKFLQAYRACEDMDVEQTNLSSYHENPSKDDTAPMDLSCPRYTHDDEPMDLSSCRSWVSPIPCSSSQLSQGLTSQPKPQTWVDMTGQPSRKSPTQYFDMI